MLDDVSELGVNHASAFIGRRALEDQKARGVERKFAGLVLQGLTRNPLADPYLLGISGGAGLAVVLLQAMPQISVSWWLVPLAAFMGAQGAALLVLLLARGSGGRLTILGLILGGVVINAFCAALMSFILARFDPFRLRITTLWLAGGIGFAAAAGRLPDGRFRRCQPLPDLREAASLRTVPRVPGEKGGAGLIIQPGH